MGVTKIEWCHYTLNPWSGCTKVNKDCQFCYLERDLTRYGKEGFFGLQEPREFRAEAYWSQPAKWNKEAEAHRERRRVFCGSWCDILEAHTDPEVNKRMNASRKRVFALVDKTPWLDWLFVTKRIENATAMFPFEWWKNRFPRNAWVIVSAGHTAAAEQKITGMLDMKIPCAVLGVSCEPLWEGFPIRKYLKEDGLYGTIKWWIDGGESGNSPHTCRPSHPDWFRDHLRECRETGVAYFFKQWGNWIHESHMGKQFENMPFPESHVHTWPDGSRSYWMGDKNAAGRRLDYREYSEFPYRLAGVDEHRPIENARVPNLFRG